MTDPAEPIEASRPEPVTRAVMIHRWEDVTFVHWPHEAAEVQPLVPDGLVVETFDGAAWVGLIPFRMRVRFPRVPIPWITFPETNVRTYVTGPDGGRGILFFSLEAARVSPVAVARASLALPYMWADMDIQRDGALLRYRSTRRVPGHRGAGTDIEIRPGPGIGSDRIPAFEDFLVSRFRLYTRHLGRLLSVDAEHEPWPLQQAEVVRLRQDVIPADGLPSPRGDAIAHFSEGVTVRIGRPKVVRGT